MHRRLLTAVLLGAALAAPATASAGTRWGEVPDIVPDAVVCGASCSIAQERDANQDLPDVLADGRGVVTGWRVSGAGGQVRLRVVAGGPATAWIGTPSTATQSAALPVRAGQLVALDGRDGAVIGFSPAPFVSGADVTRVWRPGLADGNAPVGGTALEGTAALELDIEPDADADGLGDETQDPDRGLPPGGGDPGGEVPAPTDPIGGTPIPPAPPAPPAPPVPKQQTTGPKVPRTGPRLTLPKSAGATATGVVTVTLENPYGQALRGRLVLKQSRRTVGTATVRLAAGATAAVRVRLTKAARAVVERRRKLRVTASVALKGPTGKSRTSRRTLTATVPKAGGGSKGGKDSGGGSQGGDSSGGGSRSGVDGTYRASDGQVMAVEGGKVVSFNGTLTLYCTRAGKQKSVSYGMAADDPPPTVAADGTFAWEATADYGFVKLKYDGRISGDTATGRLSVEDRSPLLGTGRVEFDYCFAGKEWSLQR